MFSQNARFGGIDIPIRSVVVFLIGWQFFQKFAHVGLFGNQTKRAFHLDKDGFRGRYFRLPATFTRRDSGTQPGLKYKLLKTIN